MKTIWIRYEDGQRRKVGWVSEDTFFSPRQTKKHLFRGGRATVEEARRDGTSSWGLDCKVCDGLIERGIVWFVVKVGKTNYRCKLIDMRDKGFVFHMKPHRAQYFLNEKEFTKEKECSGVQSND